MRGAAPLAALAFIALAVGVIAVRDLAGAVSRAIGLSEATFAAALPVGAERDGRLARAQASLTQALSAHGGDAAIWIALSQTRFLQATGAEVRTVSPALLAAAVDAGRRAVLLAPESAEAHARLAEAASLTQGGAGEAADALERSYTVAPVSEALAPARVAAAGRVWGDLDARAKGLAMAEACVARRRGAALSAAFAAVMLDPACAFPGPRNSPPAP